MRRKFLFVCGCPRSGTTYLHGVLNSHPLIALGLERFNLRMFAQKLLPDDFEKPRFFRVEAGDTWYKDLEQFGSHYRNVEEKYSAAAYFGDKIPRAYEFFGHVTTHFPDVRIVVIVRNIFDVAASYERRREKGTHWRPDWGARKAVDHWNAAMRQTLDYADLVPILPVVYEDLVGAEETVDQLAEFLEVDPEPLRAGWQRQQATAVKREPGSGAAQLDAKDVAFLSEERDEDAFARVCALARDPVNYHGAWKTLRLPPPKVAKYFAEDARAIPYERSRPSNSRVELRNPPGVYKSLDPYIACVGSAATFGRLVSRPFCDLLQERLDMPVINIGIGGARPNIFLEDPGIAALIRDAACVVVEAMSARGYATDWFLPDHAYGNMGSALRNDEQLPNEVRALQFVDHVYDRALRRGTPSALESARMICRAAYVHDMKMLARFTSSRNVLLYLSRRAAEFTPESTSFANWSGGFPHHVDQRLLDVLKPLFLSVVTVASDAGSPELICDRETGEPLAIFPGRPNPAENFYYPTTAMHSLAADALEPVLRPFVARFRTR